MSERIGVISDTHGLLRPEALTVLEGSDRIIHCGDIGRPEVIDGLRALAPVVAIRGNVDRQPWAEAFPDTAVVEANGRRLYVLHDLQALDFDPAAAGFDAVLAGHSHQPRVERRGGVLYLNPGSAGPRRFRLPVAVARLDVSARRLAARTVELEVESRLRGNRRPGGK